MSYIVRFTERAKKDMKKMDRHIAALILGWIRKNLQDCENPRLYGKPLTADHRGKWRYRIGDFRLLAVINDDTVTILVITVGHRKSVYEK